MRNSCILLVLLLFKSTIANEGCACNQTSAENNTSPTAVGAQDSQDRTRYRLPLNVRPHHYKVELTPHIYDPDPTRFYFEGCVIIYVTCLNVTDDIIVNADRLNISDTDISVKEGTSTSTYSKELFQSSHHEADLHLLHLRLIQPLSAGRRYVVHFRHFSGPLTADGFGLYYASYQDGNRTIYMATSQMSPVAARKAMPCFDEPMMKATFDVTLLRRTDTGRHYIALSNGALDSSHEFEDDAGHWWSRDHFETTPVMSTYILAFIVCDFVYLEDIPASDPNVTYRTYIRPNALHQAARVHQYGLQMFHWLNRHFKPRYGQALRKLYNIAVPEFRFGAMENWGLVAYRELVLHQPGLTTARNHLFTATVLMHELAHTWFGNYVSPPWWGWMWMKEGFATWWNWFALEQVFPHWKAVEQGVSTSTYNVMERDALPTSHPMTSDVASPAEIFANIDFITYSKGGTIVRMMQFIMGFDTFVEGLNLYLQRNLFANADTSDLFSALDEKMQEQGFGAGYMTEKMSPWVSQMGFPVVVVNRTALGYTLTQTRFLVGDVEDTDPRYTEAPFGYQWEVPITFATSDNPNMNKTREDIHWLSKHSQLHIADNSTNDSDAWIVINVDHVAYCRVLYDAVTWHALIGQLNRDPSVFTALNRGLLINDAWNLAQAGLLDLSIALNTMGFLRKDAELVPWKAFDRAFSQVDLMLGHTQLAPLIQKFIQKTVTLPLQRLTLDIDDDGSPIDVILQQLIAKYACSYGVNGCVSLATQLFSQWKDTHINNINVNLRQQFYCTAVAEGDVTDWEFVYTQYTTSDDVETETANLRQALSCSKNSTLLLRLLTLALDPEQIGTQDMPNVILDVAARQQGRVGDLAFRFVVDNFDQLKNNMSISTFSRVLTDVTNHFNTDQQLLQLQTLKAEQDVSDLLDTVSTIEAKAKASTQWRTDNEAIIRHWLLPTVAEDTKFYGEDAPLVDML